MPEHLKRIWADEGYRYASKRKNGDDMVEYVRADVFDATVEALTQLIEWVDEHGYERPHKFCGCTYCRARQVLDNVSR